MSGYRIGFLMDAYESLNLTTETSLLCMAELISRGHGVFWLEQPQLSLANGRLKGRGILLAGLDFIGEQLTEINVTSPSAVRQINEVTHGQLEKTIVDAILDRIASVAGLPACR